MPVFTGSFVMGLAKMPKSKAVPESLTLHAVDACGLSIACSWADYFPASLRNHARVKFHHLHHSIRSKQISAYGLVSAAYLGFVPIPSRYVSFVAQADRINKLNLHNRFDELRQEKAREDSAAAEFEMDDRDELKRFLKHLDKLAQQFAGAASYAALIDCGKTIISDLSPYCPPDRQTFAKGPMYLWDFAKAVNEHQLADMAFSTNEGWVLYVHLRGDTVFGHAVHPGAHRIGNFAKDPVICVDSLCKHILPALPVIDVPEAVQHATKELSSSRFPGRRFHFAAPPTVQWGEAFPTRVLTDSCVSSGEG